jgi:hypothetical protein
MSSLRQLIALAALSLSAVDARAVVAHYMVETSPLPSLVQ